MNIAGYLAFSGALGLAAAIPGPGVTALVARALGSGFRSALAMSLGLVVGDLIYLSAVVLGLALVAQTFGTLFLVVKWLGVVYLAWLAFVFWRNGIMPAHVQARRSRGGFFASVMAGLLLTLGNPKTMIFYLAILPTVVDLGAITLGDYLVLASLTVAVLLVVLVPYLVLAAKARTLFQTPRALKILGRTAGAFMAGAAAAIAVR
ncbi:MAG: lysine transporter LysE [Mesorhizobium amorphae]|nr:MAG: lysine transporter LysE [Mesorhizobium amorphae]